MVLVLGNRIEMVDGFKNLRRGLEITAHKIVNDISKDISSKINRSEPLLNTKPRQSGSNATSASVTITGSAELPSDKKDAIDKAISDAIDNTFRR